VTTESESSWRAWRVALKAGNDVLRIEIRVPAEPIRPVDLLPTLMALDDALVSACEKEAVRQGKAISCKKGCGACCRQLVPISEIEAQYLAESLALTPPERRAHILARFQMACAELERKGLRERLLNAIGQNAPTEGDRLTADYFACGVECPFLEEESCLIHAQRPLVCREYSVTSPPERCADPARHEIDRLAMPIHFSHVVRRFADGVGTSPYRWLPLVLAMNWSSAEARPMPRLPGPELLENFFRLVQAETAVDGD